MKTNFTLISKATAFISLLLIYSNTLVSQPEYDFRNAVLISGTDLSIGAKYRFPNVKTGYDAIVEIKNITGGISIDQLDGGSGYPEAFQPAIISPAGTNGYAEFQIDFVNAGTNTKAIQTFVPVTCIDIDGYLDNDGLGNPLFEFDEIKMSPWAVLEYQFGTPELDVAQLGTWVRAKNTGGLDYPGRDTSAKQVMVTVLDAAIDGLTIRVGVDNPSAAEGYRLRSVYFKRFTYPSSLVLPISNLLSFSGANSNDNINLNWALSKDNNISTIILERSYLSDQFAEIASFSLTESRQREFNYNTGNIKNNIAYYRLKLISATGKTEYSNTVFFKNTGKMANNFKVYPTIANDYFSVNISAEKRQQGMVRVFDYSGKLVYQRSIIVEAGVNNLMINDYSKTLKGSFVVMAQLDDKMYKSKIILN